MLSGEFHVILVAVLVGDAAIDGARADAVSSMMSSNDDLLRLLQLLGVVHLILQ